MDIPPAAWREVPYRPLLLDGDGRAIFNRALH